MAQRFDEKRLTLAGEPLPLAEPAGLFSVSAQQTLVYEPMGTQAVTGPQQVVWMDRNGKPGPAVSMPGTFAMLRLSRNGDRLALARTNEGNTDIWVIDLNRGTANRLTSDPTIDSNPVWSPNGEQILFSSSRSGAQRMFIRSSLPTIGTDQALPSETPLDMREIPSDWSRDYIVFLRAPSNTPLGGSDIWVKPTSGDGKPFPFVQSKQFLHSEARLSPDGRWLAYLTNESTTYQVVVQTFPDPNGDFQTVTPQGGIYPNWSRDGRELYYLALDGKLMAVSVKEEGGKLKLGAPTVLFQSPLTVPSAPLAQQYEVSPDGKKFVFIVNNTSLRNTNDSGKLTVVVNWTAALRKK